MGSKARRTALSVAGLALASGASLALAGPASAAAPTGDNGYGSIDSYTAASNQSEAVSGTYSKVEKTQISFNRQSSASTSQQRNAWVGGHDNDCDSTCNDPHGYHHWIGYPKGGYHGRLGHTRIVGFYRTYRECREAARRGGWDNYDCDFTRRGYRGWHQSWNKWGANDWRCHGTWVLTAGY